MWAHNVATLAVTASTWLLNAAIAVLTSPITLVILAITALILCGIWLVKHWDDVKTIAAATWELIVQSIRAKVIWVVDKLETAWTNAKNLVIEIWENIKFKLGEAWDSIKETAGTVWEGIKNAVIGPIKGIIEWIDSAINKAKELFGWNNKNAAQSGQSNNLGVGSNGPFAHGGIIGGSYGQAVPIIAHAGERVVPTTGVDVNQGGTSGGINITFTGAVSMDSDSRVQELADKIIKIIGRQNELARYGLG
jgi:hypothetical protein